MTLAAGTSLGPYEILSPLGAGGMGEVYRARDTRLGRDVALKIIPADLAHDPRLIKRFEREARAVAALNHPHILTVFDIGYHEGVPYVVTELLEGETLREVLFRRTPTQRQVLTFAVQTVQGLAAAHEKGIVHRDLKPENLFLTNDGRVKILDFGLAKVASSSSVDPYATTEKDLTQPVAPMGTVAYMSPEQVKAFPVDPRSDLFSFGVVLYELLSRKHPFLRGTTPATLTAILHETPPAPSSLDAKIPPALDRIVTRCLEKRPENRFESARELALALEAVLEAPPGTAWLTEVEERRPYPGLQSFTEKDAGIFFGREAEVRAMWRRIESRELLAVIGPSGAGKSSLVRAGIVASRPEGWGAIVCSPGAAPLRSLGQSLAPELASDPEALRQLLSFEQPPIAFELMLRWRRANRQALLVVDQFEELFTLNSEETQQRFASFLGRLASEAGVHVLLSLRDDFLIRCSEHEELAPVFESLTPLPALTTAGLKSALVEPAKTLGYLFEDQSLVDEMVASFEGVRGALPLLAFAVAQLWERRDRKKKVLTREAYEEIGGVAGALAQHAEATMSRIGPERQAIVRELFRNLVTAQGTRAVVDRDELLSAFADRDAAGGALSELIDARLVTGYEVEEAEGRPGGSRVEVAHESLLTAWPRLVKWRAQDEEGAVLRDQLRQAARLWEEKNRTADLLWTGTAYQEFELWRERYPGRLTALESDFARSMADKAQRRKRLLTAAAISVIVALAGVAIAIGISRHQAEAARDRAVAEARRAEAGKLLALARTELDRDPTAALAFARKSLELSDTPEARRFALEVLWRGPVARILAPDKLVEGLEQEELRQWENVPRFSPDGGWLALQNIVSGRISLFRSDGSPPRILPRPPEGSAPALVFGPGSDLLITGGPGSSLRLLSLPELREVRTVELGGVESSAWASDRELITMTRPSPNDTTRLIRAWPLPEGEPRVVARVQAAGLADWKIDRDARWLAHVTDGKLYVRPADAASRVPERIVGRLPDALWGKSEFGFIGQGDGLYTVEKSGDIRLWSLAVGAPAPLRLLRGASWSPLLSIDRDGSRLVRADQAGVGLVIDLRDFPDAEPLALKQSEFIRGLVGTFDPSGQWLLTNDYVNVSFWPVSSPRRRVLPIRGSGTWGLEFTPEGRWLISCTYEEPVRLWPLSPRSGAARESDTPGVVLGDRDGPGGREPPRGDRHGPAAGSSRRPRLPLPDRGRAGARTPDGMGRSGGHLGSRLLQGGPQGDRLSRGHRVRPPQRP